MREGGRGRGREERREGERESEARESVLMAWLVWDYCTFQRALLS